MLNYPVARTASGFVMAKPSVCDGVLVVVRENEQEVYNRWFEVDDDGKASADAKAFIEKELRKNNTNPPPLSPVDILVIRAERHWYG
jgi:hypothetical protein